MNRSSGLFRIFIFLTLLGAARGLFAAEANPKFVDLKARTGLKPFTYSDAPVALPNYVAGAKWGTQAEPIKTMQNPLSPEESIQHIVLPSGFEARFFAGEPDIQKPICMAWDERGRLWVAETFDYPNDRQPAGEGHDRIKICEDADGDGKADRFTVFAEKLSIPTSMVFANGGVIVSQAPDMLFLKDTDGDGVADVRQVLFTGWGTTDTHAGPSNLHYGPDNWIWGVVGYSGFNGTVGGKTHRFQQGFFRFRPDGSELEFIRSSNNNTWGLGFSEEGILFGSTANNNASMYMPIPNRYYEAVNGWSVARLESIADSQNFYPITDKVRQVDWHHRYTAGAGHALYTARSFPKEFWNRVAFVAEPTGHLIGQFQLEPHGADFVAHNAHSFMASDDEWTAPIAAEVGPDGALWMIDWYNYIVQHNPTPVGFKTGQGNAYETPLRDKKHGRIYRIVHQDGKPSPALNLANAPTEELVAALKKDNMLWRMHSQRLLVERHAVDAIPALASLVRDSQAAAAGKDAARTESDLDIAACHAIWTLQGLNAFSQPATEGSRTLIAALSHSSWAVRRAALTAASDTAAIVSSILENELLNDSHPQVQLAALLALARGPVSTTSGEAIFKVLQNELVAKDRWLPDAITAAGARHAIGFVRAAANAKSPLLAEAVAPVGIVAAHYAQSAPAPELVEIISNLAFAPQENAQSLLQGFTRGTDTAKKPIFSAPEQEQIKKTMTALPPAVAADLLMLVQKWGLGEQFTGEIAKLTILLRGAVTNANLSESGRIAAGSRLIALADSPDTADLLLKQITIETSPEFATGLIHTAGESSQPGVANKLLEQWTEFTPRARRAALGAMMRRATWSTALLDAIDKGAVQKSDLGPEMWQQLRSNPDRALAQRAQKLSESTVTTSAEREAMTAKLLPLAANKGDLNHGKEVFLANCAVCHTLNGEGAKIGPDLTGVGARDRKDILIDIIDPNRSVEANYRLWTLTTKSGDTVSGRLDNETQTSIEILDLTSQPHSVQRKDIAKLDASTLSIMPVGFENLPANDLTSLLEYLASSREKPIK